MKSQKQQLIEALRPFSQLSIEGCSRCDGTGKRPHSSDACLNCGGFGEVVIGFPSPEDVRAAAKILKVL